MAIMVMVLMVIWNRPSHLVEGECFSQSKAPTGLEAATYHGRCGRGRRRGQAEWVGKLEAAHLDTEIHRVDWCVEFWQLGFGRD